MSELFPATGPVSAGGLQASFERVHQALIRLQLGARTHGSNQLMAHCPVHPERTGSLHVTWTNGPRGGHTMLYCFGCQAPASEIADHLGLGLADLFDEALPERDRALGRVGKSTARRRAGQRRGRLGRLPEPIAAPDTTSGLDSALADEPELEHAWVEVARYPYVDARGELVQEVIREECSAEGSTHKSFRQVFVVDGRRLKRKPVGFQPVLFRSREVAAAAAAEVPVWLVEGEKDVLTAEGLGLVATTNAQGGQSFPDALVDELAGARVHVVLDRDATGWARGVDLHAKLTAVDARIKLFLPATTQPKSDLTDHVQAGHGVDQLLQVHVWEVETWHTLSAVAAKHRTLHQAVAETWARLEAAAEAAADGSEGAQREAGQHRSFARRWALESQIRQEALLALVDQVYVLGLKVGTEWASEAMDEAGRLLQEATEAARAAHEAAGVAVPVSLRSTTPHGEGEAAAGAGAADDQLGRDGGEGGGAAAGGGSSPRWGGEVAAALGLTDGEPGQVPGPAAPGRGRFDSREGGTVSAPVFRVLDGCIVQWVAPRREEDSEGTFKSILSLEVRVLKREYLEVETVLEVGGVGGAELMGRSVSDLQAQLNPSAPRQLMAVVVAYRDPVTGEWMHLRVSAEQWKDHSWLESLPGPVDYDHKRAGLDTVQRAVLAISDHVEDSVLYRSTGWRVHEGEHRFVHAAGAITAQGSVQAAVAFAGPLARYNLPDPTRDAGRLREAFTQHSAGMLERLPERVAAPLLGWIYRSVLGHNPWVLTLVGPPGSYKTSVAAKAMQHLGELWEHSKPGSSMSGNGDTLNALRYKLHAAQDLPWWCDDFAPTKSWLDAQRLLEETARLIHNQEGRSRSSRDGLTISDGGGPRASGLFTSEVMPRPGSGAERMLVLPLAKADVDTDLLFPLDEPESRHARALLMASFLQWLAEDLPERRARYLRVADHYAEELARGGQAVRQAAAISHIYAGWVAMTDYLLEAEAISPVERERVLARVEVALVEAADAATDPDLPSRPGARVLEILRYALRNGLAYVDDVRSGDCPPWPLAGRLGWRRTVMDMDPHALVQRYRQDRSGTRLGYVLHDPGHRDRGAVLMVESTSLEATLKAASSTMAERFEIDRTTACRALFDEGVLIADESEAARGKTRFTVKSTLHCEGRSARMVNLWLDRVLGDEPDDGLETRPLGPGDGPAAGAAEGGAADGAADGVPDGTAAGWSPGQALFDQVVPHAGTPRPVDDSQRQLVASMVQPQPEPVHPGAGGQLQADEAQEQQDQQEQEEGMTLPEYQSRPLTDLAGDVGWTAMADEPAPCVVCSRRCGVRVAGISIHLTCWETSTAQQRGTGQPAAAETAADTATQSPAQATPAGDAAPVQPAAPQMAPADPMIDSTSTSADPTPASISAAGSASVQRSGQVQAVGSGFRAAAAVVDVDGIWCSNGERFDLPYPPQHVGDLADFAHRLQLGTQVTKWRDASAQVWVGARLLAQLGIDVDALGAAPAQERDKVARELTRDQAAAALRAGYSVGGREGDSLGRWTRVWRGSQRSVWIVLLPALNHDGDEIPLLAGEPDHPTLARRIGLLAGAISHPYQLSGSTTGLDLMMALRWKDREQLFAARPVPAPALLPTVEPDISWCRPPTAEEKACQYVHAYDRSGSYLAGVAGLELGVGEAVHHPDGVAFEVKTPGYWRIEVPESGDWRMPNPLDPRGQWAGRIRWVTTPAMEFAIEQGYEPTVLEAYTWPERARVLDPWYERIRDARSALDIEDAQAQAARDQLKAIYAQTIGMLGSEVHMDGRPGYAPDRRHHIVSKARTNILRRVAQIGRDSNRWPVAVIADTIIYVSTEEDPLQGWPGKPDQLGRALGKYKVEGTGLLVDQLPYLTGGAYRGKQHLVGDSGGE